MSPRVTDSHPTLALLPAPSPIAVSIVVPMHDEQAAVEPLMARLTAVLEPLERPYEVIAVDDGSLDGTFPALEAVSARDLRVRVVRLSRRFGQQVAVTAGLDRARGDVVVIMDGDLQHCPEDVPRFLGALEADDVDVVVGVPRPGQVGWFKRQSSRTFNFLLRSLLREPVRVHSCSFRAMRRKVVRAFRRCGEHGRHVSGLVGWLGFRQGEVEIDVARRTTGRSKYGLRHMLSLALDSLTAFSRVPLELSAWLGTTMSLAAALSAVWLLASGARVEGWTWVVCALFFVGGVQLGTLGVMGSYLGRVYTEVQGRPLYVIDEMRNLED